MCYNPLGFNIVKTTFVSELWSAVERLITEGKVGGAGLSDLNPPTFFNIYDAAEIKPTSVQVTSTGSVVTCGQNSQTGLQRPARHQIEGIRHIKNLCVPKSMFFKDFGPIKLTFFKILWGHSDGVI